MNDPIGDVEIWHNSGAKSSIKDLSYSEFLKFSDAIAADSAYTLRVWRDTQKRVLDSVRTINCRHVSTANWTAS